MTVINGNDSRKSGKLLVMNVHIIIDVILALLPTQNRIHAIFTQQVHKYWIRLDTQKMQ